MEDILFIFLTTIFIATILNVFLKKIDIPTVIGYILSGLAITYIFGMHGDESEKIEHLAEFGIVFLMFTIGLEFSVGHLKAMKKEVFVYGFLQVVLTGSLFVFLAHQFFDIGIKTAIIIGFGLSLSSTAIVLKVLNENSQIHSGYGRITLGILLFQDLAIIPILLMISIFTSDSQSVSSLLIDTLISAVVVFIALFVVGNMFIERFFIWITKTNSEEIFLVSVLFIVVGAAFIADFFGFSYTLGAFLAGMTIAETKFRYRVEADLIPFRDILLGVFFVAIGMQINLHTVVERWDIILGLLLLIMSLKALVQFLFLIIFTQKRSALKSSLALFQVGEFALAIFALAKTNNMIDDQTNQILIITVVISMIITPFVLKNLKNIADVLIAEPILEEQEIISSGYKNHIIICGYGPIGKKLAKYFKDNDFLYIILEHDLKMVKEGKALGEPIYLANAAQRSVLESFNINDSLAIISAIANAKKLRLICENIASFDGKINSIVRVKNRSHEEIIEDLRIKHIINESEEISKLMLKEILTCRI